MNRRKRARAIVFPANMVTLAQASVVGEGLMGVNFLEDFGNIGNKGKRRKFPGILETLAPEAIPPHRLGSPRFGARGRRGWFHEPYRHSLAARGIKTNYIEILSKWSREKVYVHFNDPFLDRSVIEEELQNYDLRPIGLIFIEPLDDILERFGYDENVEWRFLEEDNIAMNRGVDAYPDVPIEVIVASNLHPNEKEVVLSILHELAHARGASGEGAAERWARQAYDRGCCEPYEE